MTDAPRLCALPECRQPLKRRWYEGAKTFARRQTCNRSCGAKYLWHLRRIQGRAARRK